MRTTILVVLITLSLPGCFGRRLSPPRDARSAAERQDNPKTIALPVPPAPEPAPEEEPIPVAEPRPNPPVTEGE